MDFNEKVSRIFHEYDRLISRNNEPSRTNGIWQRYKYPVLTRDHVPPFWKYDFREEKNPNLLERIGVNGTFNSGAIFWHGKYLLLVRVEGVDRKSFFAIAESDNGIDRFKFRRRPVIFERLDGETNIYDMRLTAHEDGWVYGIFCSEKHDPSAPYGDLSSAIAAAGVVRTKDFEVWERLPNIECQSQQRNVVLHPEFVNGKYMLYTRPQDSFIDVGKSGEIACALVDDMGHAVIHEEKIINHRHYHTVKELKNGEGPHPIKTSKGWLHLAHGVRSCASGYRYVLYLYMTALDDVTRVIAEPGGYFIAPFGEERVGDVSNVVFSNGWIADEKEEVFIYYASSDTRMHVATSTVEKLVDYCMNTPEDGLCSLESAKKVLNLSETNMKVLKNDFGIDF